MDALDDRPIEAGRPLTDEVNFVEKGASNPFEIETEELTVGGDMSIQVNGCSTQKAGGVKS